jgi:hypothetical protein
VIQKRPPPGQPPASYRLDGATAVFYRRVSRAELASIRTLGRFSPPQGGIPEGKYLTTTPEFARKWGEQMVACGWEIEGGTVLAVRVSAATAEGICYVGEIDGIGACYFADFDELAAAEISELNQ